MSRSHSKVYLESLLHPPHSSGAIGSRPASLHRSPSSKNLSTPVANAIDSYKPARSSALASSESAEENDTEDVDDVESEPKPSIDRHLSPSKAASVISSEDDDLDVSSHLRISTLHQSFRRSSDAGSQQQEAVRFILSLLDDHQVDEEVRIENVRNTLAEKLKEFEGNEIPPARLDNIVLSLLHRHREDVKPSGATFALPVSPSPSPFPPSPRARPRPATFRSSSNSTQTWPWTPTRPSTPSSATAGPIGDPISPFSSSPLSGALNGGGPLGESPRASPSLFHRTLSNQAPGSTRAPSSTAGNSRPQSPVFGGSGGGSPSLNVAALEFKPRSQPGNANKQPNAPSEPWLLDGNAPTGRALDDSDDDEFSPFGAQMASVPVPPSTSPAIALVRPPAGRGRPISGISGNSSYQSLTTTGESVGGSYHGSTTSTSLESSDEQRFPQSSGLEDEFEGMSMTPFDVLSSILGSIGSDDVIPFNQEQIEEALERSNWDVDAAISLLLDPQAGTLTPPSGPRSPMPRATSGTSSRAGVSVVSRDVFTNQRAGATSRSQGIPGAFAASGLTPAQQGRIASTGRVCRFFLAGECRRADCRFSHDVGRAVCRFWLKGLCLNGDECPFVHDASLLDTVANRVVSMGSHSPALQPSEPETPPNEEFPELNAPTGPKAQRSRALNDPSRTRWSQTLQRRWNSPMSQIQHGEAHLALQSKGGPIRGAPTGPRSSLNRSSSNNGSSRSSTSTSRIPLRVPMLLPTLDTGRSAAQAYASHREHCLMLSENRNRCLARAAEAWKAGNGAEARKWSQEGQSINLTLHDESRAATRSILKKRHEELRSKLVNDTFKISGLVNPSTDERGARGLRGKLMGSGLGICLGVVPSKSKIPGSNGHELATQSLDERTDVLLDCHLLHASEAIDVVEEFLIGLEREQFRGLAYLAVGLGKHTSTDTDKRRVGLATTVRNFLNSWSYPFAEHEGIVIVDPLTHS